MSEDSRKLTTDKKRWMAITKGDQDVARNYLAEMGYKLASNEKLDPVDSWRLGWALVRFTGDPAAFLWFSRRGPRSKKIEEKVNVWEKVKEQQAGLKEGEVSQLEAFASVAEELGFTEFKVKSNYEEIENYLRDRRMPSDLP